MAIDIEQFGAFIDGLRRDAWREFDALVDARLHEALALLGRPDDWAGMAARRELFWVSPFGQRGHRQLFYLGPKGDPTMVVATSEPRLDDRNALMWFVSLPWPNGHPPHLP